MNALRHNRMNRKYTLLWDQKRFSLIIRIHKDCVRTAEKVPSNNRFVQHICKINNFNCEFFGDLEKDQYGFGGLIKKDGEIGDYLDFLVPLPVVVKRTEMDCESCNGSGEDENTGMQKCYRCHAGKKLDYDWRTAYMTTASLGFLFHLVLPLTEETTAEEPQHILIDGPMAEPGQHGSSLGGGFGSEFCKFLRDNPPDLPEIVERARLAMVYANGHMLNLGIPDNFRTSVSCRENGFLTLTCPGDACGIHMSSHNPSEDEGSDFSCHNVDNPCQALTLIVGMAALEEEIDEAIIANKKKFAA
jgi:hypothetical protein